MPIVVTPPPVSKKVRLSVKEKTARVAERLPGIHSYATYAESMAAGIISYAEQNRDFAHKLAALSQTLPTPGAGEFLDPRAARVAIELLSPPDAELALRRAEWLTDMIAKQALPGAERAAKMLLTWASSYASRGAREVVIGVVIAPDISAEKPQSFPKGRAASLVVRRDLAEDPDLMRATTEAGLALFFRAIGMSHGDLKRLEPDAADWFFGERKIHYYGADEDTLAGIKAELDLCGILYASVKEKNKCVALAIDPAVNDAHGIMQWGLKPLFL